MSLRFLPASSFFCVRMIKSCCVVQLKGAVYRVDFYLELHVFGAVPVRKKDEIFYQGWDSLYFPGLPLALLFYARAFIGRTDGA